MFMPLAALSIAVMQYLSEMSHKRFKLTLHLPCSEGSIIGAMQMFGVSIIYGVSGMIVNHMGATDPAFKTVQESIRIDQNLMQGELPKAFEDRGLPTIKRVAQIDEEHTRVMLEGGVGVYNSATGELVYEQHKQRPVVYWFNRLHYNRVKGWSFMGDFFAASLIFFALSGIFMVRGKVGVMGRGKWYLIVGILIPLLYVFLSK